MDNLKKEIENKAIARTFLGSILLVISAIFSAFTISYLWNGIVVELFGLPILNMVQAYAMRFFIVYIMPANNYDEGDFSQKMAEGIVKTALYLLVGWILIQFI